MAMRFFSIVVTLAIVSLFPGAVFAQSVTVAEVADRTDKTKHTSADIKKYVASLKGRQFTASGKVHDVQTGKSGYKVVINADVPGRSRDFTVDVHMKNSAGLQKGSHVSCKGTITKFNRFTYNGIGIDGTCQ